MPAVGTARPHSPCGTLTGSSSRKAGTSSERLTLTSTPKQSHDGEGSGQALTQSNVLVGAMGQGGFLFSGLPGRLEPWPGEMHTFNSRINNQALPTQGRRHGLYGWGGSRWGGAEALTERPGFFSCSAADIPV